MTSDNTHAAHGDSLDREVVREENVKHLEMIQAIISRLAGNSFLIKAWTVTLSAAAYGISINRIDWRISTIGTVAVVAFWMLDSYFLRQERIFRLLYDYARSDIEAITRFSMATTRFRRRVHRVATFFSATLSLLYGTLSIAGLALTIIAARTR